MKNLLSLVLILIFPFSGISQNIQESAKKAKSYVSSEYDRNAVTLIGLNFNESLSSEVYQKFSVLKVPDKYYDNTIEGNILNPGVSRESVSNQYTGLDQTKIPQWLNNNKVGQKIMADWFNRQADGSFNVEVLKERGLFNANDNDLLVASASKRGESSLMDMGMSLVDQSYVMVFDYTDIITMQQFYDKNEVPADKRIMNGFQTSLNTYLFKLNFNDSVAATFFQNYWYGSNDPNATAKKEAFENASFPFVFVAKQHNDISSTQFNEGQTLAPKVQKTKNELLEQLVNTSLETVMTNVENQRPEFRVKAMVSSVHPIEAKIGKKEGLKFDQRYFVLENRERNNGTLYSKRIAVVKSMSVVDNRTVTSGQTDASAFYQIAGGGIDNYGMFLEQHNDVGLNLALGYTLSGMTGVTGRAEYYVSKAFGGFVKPGKSGKGLTSIKIYVDGGYDLKTNYTVGSLTDDWTFMRVSAGIAKDFYPLSFVHWGPFVGYGVELITWTADDNLQISSDFVEAGVRVGVNMAHNIQLIGSATYYSLISSQIEDTQTKEKEDLEYKDLFEDRMGLSLNVGIRFMF